MHRNIRRATALGAVVAGTSALAVTGIAGAAPSTHSGAVSFYSVSENNGKTLDVLTGAIVDHGYDHSVGETYQKVVLSRGTFEVYSAKFNKSFKFKTDKKACTVVGTASGANLAVSHGTGAYAGITGAISVKASFADIGIVKNGKCENLNTKSAASLSTFSGTGHVSY